MTAIDKARILILATHRFEQSELFQPRSELLDAGASVTIASIELGEIQGTEHDEKGLTIGVDATLDQVSADDFDALLLPGGVGNPDRLRTETQAIALIRAFVDQNKPVAAICHGPWLLVEADVLRGKTATAWPSIRTDLKNAGATVVDEAVVVDGNLITSRSPADLTVFTEALITAILKR